MHGKIAFTFCLLQIVFTNGACLTKKKKKSDGRMKVKKLQEPLKITFKVLKNENLGALAPACTGV